MNAVKKIIDHSSNPLPIYLPEGYENRKPEVIVLAIEEKAAQKKTSVGFSANPNGKAIPWLNKNAER